MGMKRGGRTAPSGLATSENLKSWGKYASDNSYASGGGVGHVYPKMRAGAESGMGRKELAAKQKSK